MKLNFKCFFVFLAIAYGLLPVASYAQEDINVDPLFVPEQVTFNPIPKDDLEAEKVKALKDNDKEKMYIIGMMYNEGVYVDSDAIQAAEWFKSSAELGNSNAMIELAKIYSMDKEFTGIEQNPNLAKKWIEEAEKRNNAKAIYTMGLMYEEGFPFEKSFEKAYEYYKRAANRGILNAYVKMYLAYQYGKGVDPDQKKAIYWLRRIKSDAPEGNVKSYAKDMLSDFYFELALKETNQQLKFKLFNLSWANGNRYALEAIGDMMQAGLGVKKSFTSAIVAYETAIKNYESVYAMERLGFIYLKGPSEIDRDYTKAFELFKRGADLGGVTASYMLGYMYYYGLGIQRDPAQANVWFKRSTQLSQKRREDNRRTYNANMVSSKAIENIIKSVNDREDLRMKAFEEKTKEGAVGPGLPELPDVPKY